MLSRCLSTVVHVSQAADEHKASALLCRAGITHGAWGGSNQGMHNVFSPHMQPPGNPVPPSPSSPEWEPLQLDLQAFLDRQLPVPAGTSCTSPSRAGALELKRQLLGINSMDYSPKQPCLFPQQGWMLPKQQSLNSPLSACLSYARKFHHVPRKSTWLGMLKNPNKACLGWHSCKHVQHLQFSDPWLLLEAAMICYLQHL